MVTSSHNPWNWNGVKFKAKFGGSATPAIMKKIEEELAAGRCAKGEQAAVEEVDLKKAYIEAVCAFADHGSDRESQVQICGRCHVWLRSRRSAGNLRRTGVQCVAIRGK